MTFQDLLDHLEAAEADLPVMFDTPEGRITGGYHLTEFKHARIASIDCGARAHDWDESSFQLLDGRGGEFMTAGKLAGILAKSASAIPGLGGGSLRCEFGLENRGLSLFDVAIVTASETAMTVSLVPDGAVCKPMAASAGALAASECCGGAPAKPSAAACCSGAPAASVCC